MERSIAKLTTMFIPLVKTAPRGKRMSLNGNTNAGSESSLNVYVSKVERPTARWTWTPTAELAS